jgi:pimeloyl-ACP methyl ester carboxylesterase
MPPAEAVWATVPCAYAQATRRVAAGRIGEDIAEALRLPLELDEPAGQASPLAGIAAPTLVVRGAEDLLVPPANGVLLAEGIPGADHLELAGAGHHYATDLPDADGVVAPVGDRVRGADRARLSRYRDLGTAAGA